MSSNLNELQNATVGMTVGVIEASLLSVLSSCLTCGWFVVRVTFYHPATHSTRGIFFWYSLLGAVDGAVIVSE